MHIMIHIRILYDESKFPLSFYHQWHFFSFVGLLTHSPAYPRPTVRPSKRSNNLNNIKQYLFTLSKWVQNCLRLVNCSEKTCNLPNHPAHLYAGWFGRLKTSTRLQVAFRIKTVRPPSVLFESDSCKITRLKIPSRPVMTTTFRAIFSLNNTEL